MYSCTKNFNIKTTYGIQRIIFISCLLSLVVFLISFELFSNLVNDRFSDDHFLLFLAALFFLYPTHKLLHVLGFIHDTRSLMIQKTYTKFWLPILNIRVNHPVSKLHFSVTLVLPFIVISLLTLTASYALPQYAHYFLFIFAANFGMSLLDFIYLKYIMHTPVGTYIEERKHGLELLIRCED